MVAKGEEVSCGTDSVERNTDGRAHKGMKMK